MFQVRRRLPIALFLVWFIAPCLVIPPPLASNLKDGVCLIFTDAPPIFGILAVLVGCFVTFIGPGTILLYLHIKMGIALNAAMKTTLTTANKNKSYIAAQNNLFKVRS